MIHVDVRSIPPRDRHATIVKIIDELPVGHALRVTSDHDPRALRIQVERDYPQQFTWTYQDSGPELWLVQIERAGAAR